MAQAGHKRGPDEEWTGERAEKRLRPEDVTTPSPRPVSGVRRSSISRRNPYVTPISKEKPEQTATHIGQAASEEAVQAIPAPDFFAHPLQSTQEVQQPETNSSLIPHQKAAQLQIPSPDPAATAPFDGQAPDTPFLQQVPPTSTAGPIDQRQHSAEETTGDKKARVPDTSRFNRPVGQDLRCRQAIVKRDLFGPASFFSPGLGDRKVPLEAAASHPFLAEDLKARIECEGYSFRETPPGSFGTDRQCGLVAVWISWNSVCEERGWRCVTGQEMVGLLKGPEYQQKVQERDSLGNMGIDWNAPQDLDANQLSLVAEILGDRFGVDTFLEICQQREPESFQHKVWALGYSDDGIKIRLHHNGGNGATGHWSGFGKVRHPAQFQNAGRSNGRPKMPQPSAGVRHPRENVHAPTRPQAKAPSGAELEARKQHLLAVWDEACARYEQIRCQTIDQNGGNKISERTLELALNRDSTMAHLRRELSNAHAGFKCTQSMSAEQDSYAHTLLQLVGNEVRPDGSRKSHRNKICAQVLGMQPNTFTKLISTIVKTTSGGQKTGEDLRRKKNQLKREETLGTDEHDFSLLDDQDTSRHNPLQNNANHQIPVDGGGNAGYGSVAQCNANPTWNDSAITDEQVQQLLSGTYGSQSYAPDHGEATASEIFTGHQAYVNHDLFDDHVYTAHPPTAERFVILENELDENGIEPNSGIDLSFSQSLQENSFADYQQTYSDLANSGSTSGPAQEASGSENQSHEQHGSVPRDDGTDGSYSAGFLSREF